MYSDYIGIGVKLLKDFVHCGVDDILYMDSYFKLLYAAY